MEVVTNETFSSNTNISKENIKKKIILKFLVRFYFFINHKLKLAQDKHGEESNYNQVTKDEIIKRFFQEDSRRLNNLTNSADTMLSKLFIKKLCDGSYDNDCNNYRKYLNMQLKEGQSADIISQNIIDAIKGYSEKFNAMSLNDQFIKKIKKILSGTKSQISSRDFDIFSKSISGMLKQSGLQDFKNEIQDLDTEIQEIKSSYHKKKEEIENDFIKEKEKVEVKEKVVEKIEEQIKEKDKERNALIIERDKTVDPAAKASLNIQIGQLETQIEEKDKELTKETKELKFLKKDIIKKETEKTEKINNINIIKDNDLKAVEEKEEEKYRKQGAAFFIKLIKTKRDLWEPGFDETEANKYIDNPETSLTLFQELIEFKENNNNYETIKQNITLLNELYSALRYLATEVEDKNKDIVKQLYEIVFNRIKELKSAHSPTSDLTSDLTSSPPPFEIDQEIVLVRKADGTVDNVWDLIIELPIKQLLPLTKDDIIKLAIVAFEKTSTEYNNISQQFDFRKFIIFKLKELKEEHEEEFKNDTKLEDILSKYDESIEKKEALEKIKKQELFENLTTPISNVAQGINEAARKKIISTTEGTGNIISNTWQNNVSPHIKKFYDDKLSFTKPPEEYQTSINTTMKGGGEGTILYYFKNLISVLKKNTKSPKNKKLIENYIPYLKKNYNDDDDEIKLYKKEKNSGLFCRIAVFILYLANNNKLNFGEKEKTYENIDFMHDITNVFIRLPYIQGEGIRNFLDNNCKQKNLNKIVEEINKKVEEINNLPAPAQPPPAEPAPHTAGVVRAAVERAAAKEAAAEEPAAEEAAAEEPAAEAEPAGEEAAAEEPAAEAAAEEAAAEEPAAEEPAAEEAAAEPAAE